MLLVFSCFSLHLRPREGKRLEHCIGTYNSVWNPVNPFMMDTPLHLLTLFLWMTCSSLASLPPLNQANQAFPGNACIPCREYVRQLQRSLAQCALDTFSEFEEAVGKDSTKTPVVDGTVHPLTSYVINYIKFLFEYVVMWCEGGDVVFSCQRSG